MAPVHLFTDELSLSLKNFMKHRYWTVLQTCPWSSKYRDHAPYLSLLTSNVSPWSTASIAQLDVQQKKVWQCMKTGLNTENLQIPLRSSTLIVVHSNPSPQSTSKEWRKLLRIPVRCGGAGSVKYYRHSAVPSPTRKLRCGGCAGSAK